MSREFPMISQFRVDSPACPNGHNGSVVAGTEAILRRYRPGEPLPRQSELGASMGRRHRQREPDCVHGICPRAWCLLCSYLELKARHVPVGYGRLTIAQFRSHLRRRHAIHVGGSYEPVRHVGATSYSDRVPARGRSDDHDQGKFQHSLVAWQVGEGPPDGAPSTYIVSDPDFGSARRPLVPPYCEYDARELEAMYARGGLEVAYCLTPPPPLDAPGIVPPPGVTLLFGGALRGQGIYVVGVEGARQRSSPYIRAGNMIRELPEGTEFRVAQTSLTGTNVTGSSTWHGDATGTVWMHHSVVGPRA
jgi:hypothetical protein